jgi:hypothetical protein
MRDLAALGTRVLRIEIERDIFDYCRELADLGCGLYPKGTHVHVDVRSRATIWVDLSRYGEAARYVRDAKGWVREHPQSGRPSPKVP